jgi:hypothetical protein
MRPGVAPAGGKIPTPGGRWVGDAGSPDTTIPDRILVRYAYCWVTSPPYPEDGHGRAAGRGSDEFHGSPTPVGFAGEERLMIAVPVGVKNGVSWLGSGSGQPSQSQALNSELAERVGFEPTIPSRV